MGFNFGRKRLWIKPPFQRRLLLHVGSYFLLYVLVIGLLGFFVFIQEALVSKQFKLGFGIYAAYVASLRPLFFASILLLPYFIYDMIKFTNRIAGPLYRCQKLMREMAEGKTVSEFLPRKHDLLPEFFADFNTLVRVWNNSIAAEANKRSAAEQPDEEQVQHV